MGGTKIEKRTLVWCKVQTLRVESLHVRHVYMYALLYTVLELHLVMINLFLRYIIIQLHTVVVVVACMNMIMLPFHFQLYARLEEIEADKAPAK